MLSAYLLVVFDNLSKIWAIEEQKETASAKSQFPYVVVVVTLKKQDHCRGFFFLLAIELYAFT